MRIRSLALALTTSLACSTHPALDEPAEDSAPVEHAAAAARDHGAAPAAAPAHASAHWTYAGAEGPEHWGELDPAFSLCKSGQHQTPIDLHGAAQKDPTIGPLAFAYAPTPLRILNNGHTVQVEVTSASTLRAIGQTWRLLQFHAHAPSEHTVDGESFALEVHFVHKNDEGRLAVVGVLFAEGAESKALAPYFAYAPHDVAPAADVPGTQIDLGALFPKKSPYFHYVGSLTTPPCSEGVEWFVLAEPQQIGKAQLAAFAGAEHGPTNRPVQPDKGRDVAAFRP